jgi:hypothetical protein
MTTKINRDVNVVLRWNNNEKSCYTDTYITPRGIVYCFILKQDFVTSRTFKLMTMYRINDNNRLLSDCCKTKEYDSMVEAKKAAKAELIEFGVVFKKGVKNAKKR